MTSTDAGERGLVLLARESQGNVLDSGFLKGSSPGGSPGTRAVPGSPWTLHGQSSQQASSLLSSPCQSPPLRAAAQACWLPLSTTLAGERDPEPAQEKRSSLASLPGGGAEAESTFQHHVSQLSSPHLQLLESPGGCLGLAFPNSRETGEAPPLTFSLPLG